LQTWTTDRSASRSKAINVTALTLERQLRVMQLRESKMNADHKQAMLKKRLGRMTSVVCDL
jgi:hypothetical protein